MQKQSHDIKIGDVVIIRMTQERAAFLRFCDAGLDLIGLKDRKCVVEDVTHKEHEKKLWNYRIAWLKNREVKASCADIDIIPTGDHVEIEKPRIELEGKVSQIGQLELFKKKATGELS